MRRDPRAFLWDVQRAIGLVDALSVELGTPLHDPGVSDSAANLRKWVSQ
jgi:hypothetical protein